MNDPNENRKGYKNSQVGWIPEEWGCMQFTSVATIEEGQVSPTEEPYLSQFHIGPEDITAHGPLSTSLKTCRELGLISGKYRFHKGAVIYCKIRPELNKAALVAFEGVCSADAYPLYANEKEVSPEFLVSALHSSIFLRQVIPMSTRSGMPKVNRDELNSTLFAIPPLPEQRKIAAILSAWDRAIAALDELLAAKRRRKLALMQQLLSGQTRLPGCKGKWAEVPLSSLLTESRLPGHRGDVARKITIRLYGKGVEEKVESQAGSKATQYYMRKAGQFIYSKLDFLNGAFGIVPEELDGFESTLDLPAFDIASDVSPHWLLAYVSMKDFYKRCFHLGNGGRKARRINPSDFKHILIEKPRLPEQQKIAAVLSAADRELSALSAKRDALKLQKKGLMQQLLTGQKRVKV